MSLATMICITIEFDVLTHFQKICMIVHVYKMEFLYSTISYVRIDICGTNWVTFFEHFCGNLPKKPICGLKTMTRDTYLVLLEQCPCYGSKDAHICHIQLHQSRLSLNESER